jgi:hypothetical protein
MTLRLLLALSLCAGFASTARARQPADGVYVLAAIQRLHEREPAFGYDHLRCILDAVRPDVVVLEVRPDEAAERKDTQGRPEYPKVVWPWLAEHPLPVISMEPGGKAFAEMTGAAGAMFAAFDKEQPAAAAYMGSLRKSLSTALLAHWSHPADAHDRVTADLVRAEALAQAELGGPQFEKSQAAWDGFMVARAREAIAANPGKRVLVLASYRNLDAFREGLKGEPRLVDIEPWLRETLR